MHKLDDGKGWEGMTVSQNNRYLVLGDDQGGVTLIDLKQPDQVLLLSYDDNAHLSSPGMVSRYCNGTLTKGRFALSIGQ